MTQGRILIDSDRCKGCELCISVCPQHVIAMSGTFNSGGYLTAQLLEAAGACTGCGICAVICPDTAITVYREAAHEPRNKNQGPAMVRSGSQWTLRVPVLGSGERRLS
jgi:2-oxoglutarate ferredoxin oxidoreductase subunit delta